MQTKALEAQRSPQTLPAPKPGPQPLDPKALQQVSGGAKGPISKDGWSWN